MTTIKTYRIEGFEPFGVRNISRPGLDFSLGVIYREAKDRNEAVLLGLKHWGCPPHRMWCKVDEEKS